MISQSRWDEIIEEVESCLVDRWYAHSITKEGLSLIMSVLKNNTPFQVVPDCVAGKGISSGQNDILLETKHFKVLGDKE